MHIINYREIALFSAKKESEQIEVVSCPNTGLELFYRTPSGNVFSFSNFGECRECHKQVHISALNGLLSECEWPIEYVGTLCKECFKRPDPEVALTEKEKKDLSKEIDDDEE